MTTAESALEQTALASLVSHVAERTGLDFSGSHRDRMAATVRRMFHESGVSDTGEYEGLLVRDVAHYEALIDRLTVGETYFFREPSHLELLRHSVVPEWRARDRGPLRVWSAGCASGEEAYSVAITLTDMGLRGRFEVTGTDLSERALDRARSATYGPWSLRRCDDTQRRAWFHAQGKKFQLHDRYRDAVQWRRRGLLDGPPARGFDVVLCRNVLIYLTPDAIAVAAQTLHDALRPDGWLLLGASDPLLDHPGLHRETGGDAVVYRGRERRQEPVRRSARRFVPASAAPTVHPVPTNTARPTRSGRPIARGPAEPADAGTIGAELIRELGGRGQLDEARDVAAAAIAADPDDAEVRCLAAMVHLDAGRPLDAARAAAAAVYLDPEVVVGHLVLARAEQAAGHRQKAERSYHNALELLVAMPPDAEVVLTDGECAGGLITTVASWLEASRRGGRP